MQPTQALISLRYVTRIAATIILLVVAVGFFLPSDFKIERSIQIPENTAGRVLERLSTVSEWEEWVFVESGHLERIEGQSQALLIGKKFNLVYPDKQSKLGSLEVTAVEASAIHFLVQPNQKSNVINNVISMEHLSSGELKVTWTVSGELSVGFLGPYLALFANQIAGGNLEKSLAQLSD